ncbi:unnamed protein product [Polarella glacialis]|uniref:Uncharacterized protein n=1 Tax=Polarella glacialis TaxID=89957 RepID=A0A813E8X9_POLGL|nr:unnamed protein product [Polarella glacialis]|mmetsp:Transcript_71463/g.115300  ORF Transcript_71463/g.115300 Transcript_71463/m.115300 type:complete len:111 (+) Transcript_71463:96-428(+)
MSGAAHAAETVEMLTATQTVMRAVGVAMIHAEEMALNAALFGEQEEVFEVEDICGSGDAYCSGGEDDEDDVVSTAVPGSPSEGHVSDEAALAAVPRFDFSRQPARPLFFS